MLDNAICEEGEGYYWQLFFGFSTIFTEKDLGGILKEEVLPNTLLESLKPAQKIYLVIFPESCHAENMLKLQRIIVTFKDSLQADFIVVAPQRDEPEVLQIIENLNAEYRSTEEYLHKRILEEEIFTP